MNLAALLMLSLGADTGPCGSALCVGSQSPQQSINLGGSVQATPGTWADGGLAIVQPLTQGASLVLQGNQSTTSTTPDVVVRSRNSRTGTAPIFDVQNGQGGKSVFRVTAQGITIDGGSGTLGALNVATLDAGTATVGLEIQATDGFHEFLDHAGSGYWQMGAKSVSGEGNNTDNFTIRRTGGSNPYFRIDDSNGKTVSSFGFAVSQAGASGTDERPVPTLTPNDGGVLAQACISDFATMSTGAVTVTFVPAFTGVPTCSCSEIAATPLACGATSTPTTSSVALGVSTGASNRIMYTCCGTR